MADLALSLLRKADKIAGGCGIMLTERTKDDLAQFALDCKTEMWRRFQVRLRCPVTGFYVESAQTEHTGVDLCICDWETR